MKFDELLFSYLGEFGRYQKIQVALFCLPPIFVAMQSLSWTFTASNLPHRCRLSENEPLNSSYWSDSPLLAQSNCSGTGKCRYDSCQLADGSKCPFGYVYDHSEIKYSAMNRWDIVCDRSILKAFIQSLYYVGQMAGSLAFGYLGDSIGRKKVFFIALGILMMTGSSMIVAPHWSIFGLLRGLVGFAHPGIITIGVVIATELIGPSKRKIAAVLSGLFFAVGQAILGALAYFIRDYQYLQLAISIPTFGFIIYWWFVPESPRWLVSKKRYSDADKIMQLAGRINKAELPEKWWKQLDDVTVVDGKNVEEKSYGFMDLVRTPAIRTLTFACIFLYFAVAMIYYGIAMKTDFLGGNLYATFIIGSLIEVPALIALNCFADRLGRRPIFAGSYFIAAFSMLSNLFISSGAHWAISMLQFLATKAAMTVAYAMVYMVIPEVFPTVIRNTAAGVSSMVARAGTVAASYMAMWIYESVGPWAMIVPFGSISLVAGFVVLYFIPETMGQPLPETIEEVEERRKSKKLRGRSGGKAGAEDAGEGRLLEAVKVPDDINVSNGHKY